MSARDLLPGITRDDEDESAGDVMGTESMPLLETEVASPAAKPPITEEQWVRILAGRKFRIMVSERQQKWAGSRAVSCITCKHAGRAAGGHDPWRAHCGVHSKMVSNAFPKLCREHKPN